MTERTVRLLQLPTETFRQLQEHSDEVLRELTLLADDDSRATLPPRLMDILQKLRTGLPVVWGLREAIAAARRHGEDTTSVEFMVSEQSVRDMRLLHDLLSEVDGYARSGRLLAVELSATALALREWIVEEAERQLAGGPPRPWPAVAGEPHRDPGAGQGGAAP